MFKGVKNGYKTNISGYRWATILLLTVLFTPLKAQNDVEYRMDVGAGAGVLNYLGDFNGNLLKNMQPMGALVARYKFSPRLALKLDVLYSKLKGDTKNMETYYPDYNAENPYQFNNNLIDGSLHCEFNFLPYGTGQDYRGAKRFTPYTSLGIGTTFVSTTGKNVFTLNFPVGVGVKYKAGNRLNVALEWMIHFTLSDELDGVKDPYYVKSSGLFKNTDCYSMLQLSVTYDIWAKCKTCNNNDE